MIVISFIPSAVNVGILPLARENKFELHYMKVDPIIFFINTQLQKMKESGTVVIDVWNIDFVGLYAYISLEHVSVLS